MKKLRISVEERTVNGPAFLKGVRILFATDIHLRPEMDAGRIAALLSAHPADLILLGGDFADTQEQALRLFDALRILRAPLGIFAVPGNNDIEAFGSNAALADALESFGCCLLVNRSSDIVLPGGTLAIGGVDEWKYGTPDAAVFSGKADYHILLSHYPITSDGFQPDLMLCGHTHGGQFNFLGLTPYTIGFERLGSKSPRCVSGFVQIGRTGLLVSKGVGASRIPLRVGVRPEVHLLSFNC